MFYRIIKIFTRLALQLFCREITINNKTILSSTGPLLLACNHPNSFLDAIIVASHFDAPVHFLADANAFEKPFVRKLLSALNIIPVAKATGGFECLTPNNTTFEQCRQLLLQKQIVLIFAEGLCENNWTLKPLKEDAVRIALDAWTQPSIAEAFQVLPIGLNYNSFRQFGKRVIVHFGKPLKTKDFLMNSPEGERIDKFNHLLFERLREGVIESQANGALVQMLVSNHSLICSKENAVEVLKKQQAALDQPSSKAVLKQLESPYLVAIDNAQCTASIFWFILLLLPGFAGWLLQAPLLISIKTYIIKKTKDTVLYDSVFFVLLLIFYPLYWAFLNCLCLVFIKVWYVQLVVFFMPVTAWLYLVWKDSWQRMFNYFILIFIKRKATSSVLQ